MVITRTWVRAACLATAGLGAFIGLHPVAAAPANPPVEVVVVGPSEQAAAGAVNGVGGQVTTPLPIVNGVAAVVPADEVVALRASGVEVVPDLTLRTTGSQWGGAADAAQLGALDPPPSWSPNAGASVTVALVDTGVANTPGLTAANVVHGPDLSGEGDGLDHYGQGTFMAGLIAGNGGASGIYGVAPGATLVSVKVAGADGSTSLSKVIAGIGWVVVNRDAYRIKVLSLSLGADIPVNPQVDPLDAAVEAAWAAGITVVASAGNDGVAHVTSPGDDPWVVTAGALDTASMSVPSWSGKGGGKPDVLAPAVSVISLRAPGSTVDQTYPNARVGTDGFRGTGTSMATALTAGSAALLLVDHPAATPDDIKGALEAGGADVRGSAAPAVDVTGADRAPAQRSWWQHHPIAFDGLGVGLGNSMPWTSQSWTSQSWTSLSWTSQSWTSLSWTSQSWTSLSWTSLSWTSLSWTSLSWTSQSWTTVGWG